MFVKLVTYRENPRSPVNKIHECTSVSWKFTTNGYLFLDLETPKGTINLELEKKENRTIYFMNDRGKTIDSIQW